MTSHHPFKVGDIVYIKTGHAPREITAISPTGVLCTRYVRDEDQHYPPLKPKPHYCFEFYAPNEEPTPMSKKLFKTLDPVDPKFGTYLATAANGEIVLETQDGIKAFPPDQIEEVIPFTIRVRALNASCGKDYTVTTPTNLAPDDVILNTAVHPPEFAIVEAVDTKKRDRPALKYRKVMFA